jgi:hypothetical protein
MRASLLTFLLITGFAKISFAWGAEGHRAIGGLAQELISPGTQIKVQQLLNESGDKDLAAASTWADEVRENSHSDHIRPKDAEVFNREFPNNSRWHFVDLPLGTNSLAEEERFIQGTDDVVHAIERCITVLEQSESVPGGLSRTQALRLLVHFVGDIHQPLHCGTGFYKLSDTKPPVLVTNPEDASGLPNDRGGNDLFYGPREELHALWDTGLIAEIADTFDSRSLEALLKREYAPFLSPATPGDYHRWAETWALESVKVANSAYAGIRFNSVETMGPENQLWISITLPPDYHQKSSILAARQLTKAAVRLARLLDRIRWPQIN